MFPVFTYVLTGLLAGRSTRQANKPIWLIRVDALVSKNRNEAEMLEVYVLATLVIP